MYNDVQRVRTLDDSVTFESYPYTTVRWNPSPTYKYYTFTRPDQQVTQSTVDIENESFFRRRSDGEIFNNPFNSTRIVGGDIQTRSFGMEYYYLDANGAKVGNAVVAGPHVRPEFVPDYIPHTSTEESAALKESVSAKAITMAYANRSLVVQAVSMTVAEGRKTIQSIYEILFRVAEITLAAKRLDWRYLRSELSPMELSNRYMELRYAIRPLMIDAENAVKAFNTEVGKERKTARGGSDDRIVISDSYVSNLWGQIDYDVSRTVSYDVTARAGILCNVDVDKLNVYGIDQLAETVLEIVPFSFIVGWFLNIADYVSSWTPKAGIKELASWCTVKETITQVVDVHNARYTSAHRATYPYGDVTLEGSKLLTTVITTRTPSPPLSAWPRLDINLDALKVVDLAIITRGILSGKITKLMR